MGTTHHLTQSRAGASMSRQNATSAATVRALLHKAQALELRRGGASYREIARRLGIGKSRAHELVRAGVDSARGQVAESSDELLALELSRLDGLLYALWPRAARGELAAVDRVIRIGERRARLLGLDAPARTALQGGGDDAPPITTGARVAFYLATTGCG